LPGKHRSKSITMIIQDMLATADMDNKVIVTSELVAKINCLIILMGVIFTLLCILLTGCFVMLVYLFAKRRRRPKNDGSCRCKCQDHSLTQPGSGHLINNSLSSHQFVPYSHQQKYIWTVESDPIYEDIKEVKKKPVSDNNNYTKVTKEPKKSLSNSSSMSTVQYGVITAKEVAKFVPCTDINIRR